MLRTNLANRKSPKWLLWLKLSALESYPDRIHCRTYIHCYTRNLLIFGKPYPLESSFFIPIPLNSHPQSSRDDFCDI
uniref:Uncharacterized protein n=1 Tax=Rhizophora mucronata TaxID=61149 RepID=A0A2P2NZI0_RHIMU